MEDLLSLQTRVRRYQEVLGNTENYRKDWHEQLKPFILNRLETITEAVQLDCKIEVKDQMRNLETIILSLGVSKSGIYEKIGEDTEKAFIKSNGALVYQQLFNGKVQVMIIYPHIEGYGKPGSPKIIAIYRPNEIKEPFIVRHLEDFMKEITSWEDFDDDNPPVSRPIGFDMASVPTSIEDES